MPAAANGNEAAPHQPPAVSSSAKTLPVSVIPSNPASASDVLLQPAAPPSTPPPDDAPPPSQGPSLAPVRPGIHDRDEVPVLTGFSSPKPSSISGADLGLSPPPKSAKTRAALQLSPTPATPALMPGAQHPVAPPAPLAAPVTVAAIHHPVALVPHPFVTRPPAAHSPTSVPAAPAPAAAAPAPAAHAPAPLVAREPAMPTAPQRVSSQVRSTSDAAAPACAGLHLPDLARASAPPDRLPPAKPSYSQKAAASLRSASPLPPMRAGGQDGAATGLGGLTRRAPKSCGQVAPARHVVPPASPPSTPSKISSVLVSGTPSSVDGESAVSTPPISPTSPTAPQPLLHPAAAQRPAPPKPAVSRAAPKHAAAEPPPRKGISRSGSARRALHFEGSEPSPNTARQSPPPAAERPRTPSPSPARAAPPPQTPPTPAPVAIFKSPSPGDAEALLLAANPTSPTRSKIHTKLLSTLLPSFDPAAALRKQEEKQEKARTIRDRLVEAKRKQHQSTWEKISTTAATKQHTLQSKQQSYRSRLDSAHQRHDHRLREIHDKAAAELSRVKEVSFIHRILGPLEKEDQISSFQRRLQEAERRRQQRLEERRKKPQAGSLEKRRPKLDHPSCCMLTKAVPCYVACSPIFPSSQFPVCDQHPQFHSAHSTFLGGCEKAKLVTQEGWSCGCVRIWEDEPSRARYRRALERLQTHDVGLSVAVDTRLQLKIKRDCVIQAKRFELL
ncbi:hypothetical protein PAPYR_9601 [Paratrimastix pyriformis]|uniref:Uncharacterized protein n=1 Tax=Paratrimastix pyriformis TaxID=342808 RepID=A0ABQ8U9L7_9EUKA|nr:hypothetical protein PAPYR_9601 [Paratrimastix pyriformis]